ncbi:MAG TPA: hemerythrin domain-containing protein [Planktothrix sp.]|jgi:hypothetical protein
MFNLDGIKNAISSFIGGTEDSGPDAAQMLEEDHRKVKKNFGLFADAEDEEKADLVAETLMELTVHTQLEEELVYPIIRTADKEIIDEAEQEHHVAEMLIAELQGLDCEDPQVAAKFKVLGESVKHHIKEEESKALPVLRSLEIDLKELGARMAVRKQELISQYQSGQGKVKNEYLTREERPAAHAQQIKEAVSGRKQQMSAEPNGQDEYEDEGSLSRIEPEDEKSEELKKMLSVKNKKTAATKRASAGQKAAPSKLSTAIKRSSKAKAVEAKAPTPVSKAKTKAANTSALGSKAKKFERSAVTKAKPMQRVAGKTGASKPAKTPAKKSVAPKPSAKAAAKRDSTKVSQSKPKSTTKSTATKRATASNKSAKVLATQKASTTKKKSAKSITRTKAKKR